MATKRISLSPLSPEELRAHRLARRRAQGRVYYQKHRAKRVAWTREDRLAHPDKYARKDREQREKYHETRLAYNRAYREANRERLRAYDRLTYHRDVELSRQKDRESYQRNAEKRRAKTARWRERNPERVQAYSKEWLQNNPEKSRERCRQRRARRQQCPINDFTAVQWRALCKAAGYRCAYCGKKFPFLKLEPDHLTPYAKQGSNTLHNILPCCGSCNSRKKDRAVLKPVQPFLLVDEDAAD